MKVKSWVDEGRRRNIVQQYSSLLADQLLHCCYPLLPGLLLVVGKSITVSAASACVVGSLHTCSFLRLMHLFTMRGQFIPAHENAFPNMHRVCFPDHCELICKLNSYRRSLTSLEELFDVLLVQMTFPLTDDIGAFGTETTRRGSITASIVDRGPHQFGQRTCQMENSTLEDP